MFFFCLGSDIHDIKARQLWIPKQFKQCWVALFKVHSLIWISVWVTSYNKLPPCRYLTKEIWKYWKQLLFKGDNYSAPQTLCHSLSSWHPSYIELFCLGLTSCLFGQLGLMIVKECYNKFSSKICISVLTSMYIPLLPPWNHHFLSFFPYNYVPITGWRQ